MKPDEEMHAAIEEVELDPCDLFVYLCTLIVEGRIPGLTEKGYGEGPHCPPPLGQSRHQCDSTLPPCQEHELLEKHMMLLWRNGIPMCIEVLLYPECCTEMSRQPQVEISSVPDTFSLLLEQWTVHMLPRRVADANINSRGLIQAVRSFLHFSQLSAWLSLTGGKSPRNVHYRICVPGEAFSSKFSQEPNAHQFPVANCGRNNAMKVTLKALPRCGHIPPVPCTKHVPESIISEPCIRPLCGLAESEISATSLSEPENAKNLRKSRKGHGHFPGKLGKIGTHKLPDAHDTLLGDSLLDPPQSLQMYPKRYQSPSRCGSPSVEVPEHLMFGVSRIARREVDARRMRCDVPERSRPHRRPVVERFLKKMICDEAIPDAFCPTEMDLELETTRSVAKKPFQKEAGGLSTECTSYLCAKNYGSTPLPQDEMEAVLSSLRRRHSVSKHAKVSNLSVLPGNNSETVPYSTATSTSLQDKLQTNRPCVLPKHSTCHEKGNKVCHCSSCRREDNLDDSVGQGTFRCTKYSVLYSKCSLSTKLKDSETFSTNCFKCASNLSLENDVPVDNRSCDTTDFLDHSHGETSPVGFRSMGVNSVPTEGSFLGELSRSSSDESAIGEPEKWSTFPVAGLAVATSSAITIPPSDNTVALGKQNISRQKTSNGHLLKHILTLNSAFGQSSTTQQGCAEWGSHQVPSAADKANFRRSLDSATNLVFHQKTGLPLTSSPAPIRKSGTCFDFDSSITSVSAIKRALFEKDPDEEEGEEETDQRLLLSSSAPASTSTGLLGNFEESVLNGRLEPVSTVEGFTAEIGASGSYCPRHINLPVTVFFYSLCDVDKVTSPYLGHINLGKKGYHIPKKGTIQVTLFNPLQTVIKMFVVQYDMTDMPPSSQTFLRQRTLYMPTDASEDCPEARKWLRYVIHLRFASTKSGRIYLHTDIRIIIFRKCDLDAATIHGQRPYELRSFTQGPSNPRFSPHK